MTQGRRKVWRFVVLFTGLLWLLALPAWADTIELNTGQVIEGKCQRATEKTIVFDIRGRAKEFRLEDVRTIYCVDMPVPPAQRPAPPMIQGQLSGGHDPAGLRPEPHPLR